jgi:hypothetical protein
VTDKGKVGSYSIGLNINMGDVVVAKIISLRNKTFLIIHYVEDKKSQMHHEEYFDNVISLSNG